MIILTLESSKESLKIKTKRPKNREFLTASGLTNIKERLKKMNKKIYCSYKRLKSLFYFEYETSFTMTHRLSDNMFLSADKKAFEKKLYDKFVEIFCWNENKKINEVIFKTDDFTELKKYLATFEK